MTSKNLFFKLLKENIKGRVWTIALSMVVFFIFLPIYCAIDLDRYSRFPKDDAYIIENIIRYMGPRYDLLIIITVATAIICGLSGFLFLHSRKKVDLYHSIPVRRETMFAINYINGLLIYLFPYVINVFLCFIVLQLNDYMNMKIFTSAILAIGINSLFYSLIYTIVIIAVMLTGKLIVSCFGTAIFLLYGPTIMGMKELYFSSFFKTYYSNSNTNDWASFLSPVGSYIKIQNQFLVGDKVNIHIVTTFITTIVLVGFALFLYKKRPSEVAGNSMAFHYSKPVIKLLLVIPLSLGGGIIFREITNKVNSGWFIFGLIFTFVIIYAVIEITYNFDIRSAFRNKKQLLSCAVIIGVIITFFQLDVFHYDTYIPEKNKIKSMSVAILGVDNNLQYFDFLKDDINNVHMYNYNIRFTDKIDYQLKNMELFDFEAAYDMAKVGVENRNNDIENNNINFYVKYSLNNGKEVLRKYNLSENHSYELMKEVYANPEFKKVHFPINLWDEDKISEISFRYGLDGIYNKYGLNGIQDLKISFDGNEKKHLIEIYKEELNNLSLDEISESYPLATMQIEINGYIFNNYYVYPSFKNTIDFLKSHGFDATKKVESKDVIEILVYNYKVEDTMYINDGYTSISSPEIKPLSYTDQTKIAKILPVLMQEDYYQNNPYIIKAEEYLSVVVNARMKEYGTVESYYYKFKQGEIPDFIMRELGLSID